MRADSEVSAPPAVTGGGGTRAAGARGEAGQATLELALCLPLVALMLGAVVETGMIASDQARLWHAAREAARVAVVDPDPDAARRAAGGAGLGPLDLGVEPSVVYRRQGEALTVALAYSPRARIPLLAPLVSRLTLTARATMRIEQP